jgi:hypothetical protein
LKYSLLEELESAPAAGFKHAHVSNTAIDGTASGIRPCKSLLFRE